MSASHGSLAVFKLKDAANVLQDVTQYLTNGGLNQQLDMAESSHLGDTVKEYVAGLSDASVPLAGDWDPTIDAHLFGILRLPRDAEYYPAGLGGTAGTNVKYSFNGTIKNYVIATPVNGLATFTCDFQVNGTISRSLV